MRTLYSVIIAFACMLACADIALSAASGSMNISVEADTYIAKNYMNSNFGSEHDLLLDPLMPWVTRSLLRFPLTTIPDGMDITKVELNLYSEASNDLSTKSAAVHHLSSDSWAESGAGSVTWNTAPAFDSTPASTLSLAGDGRWYSFDITALVLQELLLDHDKTSLLVKLEQEDEENLSMRRRFRSKEFSAPMLRPYLKVTYQGNAPIINTVNAPSELAEGELLKVSFTIIDAEGNIDTVAIYRNGVPVNKTLSYTERLSYESAGDYNFTFFVNDSTGFSDTESRLVHVANVRSLVINEFSSDSSNNATEWIELYNPANAQFSVSSCALTTSYYDLSIPLAGSIPANGFGVIDLPYVTLASGILQDSGDLIMLNCSGIVYDKVSYGSWGGNGSSKAPRPGFNQSVGRISDGLDTDDDAADFMLFSAASKDASNNQTVADVLAPLITELHNGTVTNESFQIIWTTDEEADSGLLYGEAPALGSNISIQGVSTYHNVELTGLLANTTYYYQALSCDSSMNCALSPLGSLRTAANSPACSPADGNCNACIELSELLTYINRWKANSADVALPQLLGAINLWKSGVGC